MKSRAKKRVKPIHPGEILREEFLKPMNISQYKLANDIDVPRPRINQIIREERGISADTALRLARYFETSPEFWMNLQMRFDLLSEEQKKGREIRKNIDRCREKVVG